MFVRLVQRLPVESLFEGAATPLISAYADTAVTGKDFPTS